MSSFYNYFCIIIKIVKTNFKYLPILAYHFQLKDLFHMYSTQLQYNVYLFLVSFFPFFLLSFFLFLSPCCCFLMLDHFFSDLFYLLTYLIWQQVVDIIFLTFFFSSTTLGSLLYFRKIVTFVLARNANACDPVALQSPNHFCKT